MTAEKKKKNQEAERSAQDREKHNGHQNTTFLFQFRILLLHF